MNATTSKNPMIAEKHGLMIAIGLLIFFFIMRTLNLLHVVELRVFNVVIMVVGIIMALKSLKKKIGDEFTYFRGMGVGVTTGIIGSILFGLFVFFYVQFIDEGLMQSIIANEPMGRFLNPYIVAVIIAVEGIASALLATFIIMNYTDPTKLE